jgi:cysteine desulfurase
VAAIVGLGAACELAHQELRSRTASLAETRDRLEAELKTVFPELRVNGHPKARLPNTLNVTFPGIDAERLLEAIGLEVAASAGAACHSDQVSISHVLKAIGLSEAQARSTLRFSTGKMTTQAEIDQAASAIQRAIQGL